MMILMESNPIFLICELLVILTFNTSWFIDNICNVVLLLTAELMSKFFNNISDDFYFYFQFMQWESSNI